MMHTRQTTALFFQICALAALAALAACASVKPSPGSTSGTGSTTSAAATASVQSTKQRLGSARVVSIKADCGWTDENGYAGKLKLIASEGRVQDFSALVSHPKHGTCHFDMADFRQTKETPAVELKSNASPCTVRMWGQGRKVAVAFSSCKSMCTGDVVDYLWPILADASTGSCG
jgi:hypothetical protein